MKKGKGGFWRYALDTKFLQLTPSKLGKEEGDVA